MKKYYIVLFLFLCLNISLDACDRCDDVDEYVKLNEAWDLQYQYTIDYENDLYWYLEGRLSAWDEIKYIEDE